MDLIYLSAILAMAPQPAPGTQSNPKAEFLRLLGFLVFFGVIFYFIALRPQQKRAREHAQLLKNLRPGDKILSSGGVLGVVITVKEKSVTIRSADSKMELSKSAVAEIVERSGESSES